ncbi:MAG TPA: lipid-binding SYLF domain-containing protein [Candidatus Dormibacteraeota bacterium]|jgi:lipid-binding SYLF domain-containing protein|nr:lipid-binding SYLF domain-containing protein [Candidatus Dormibacteraeota bacterium]
MKKLLLLTLIVSVGSFSFAADEKESKAADRVQAAAEVLDEIQGAPDKGIPQEVLGSAECVAVVPSMLKGGFIVGAKYGRGLASCRTPKGWSAPAFFVVTGGSFGFQIGGQAVDLVLLIMNKDGMKHLLSSEFALGADASVAAGPVGRHAEGDTDWKMRAEVLTYSRARGLFAGVTLNGAQIKQDKDSTREFYGRMVSFPASLQGEVDAPAGSNAFLASLAKWAQAAAK